MLGGSLCAWPRPDAFGQVSTYPIGARLFREGDAIRGVYLIDSGVVRLDSNRDGTPVFTSVGD